MSKLPPTSLRKRIDRALHQAVFEKFGEASRRRCHIYAYVGAAVINGVLDTTDYRAVSGRHWFRVGRDEDGEFGIDWSGFSELSAHSWVIRVPKHLRGKTMPIGVTGVELVDHSVRFREELAYEKFGEQFEIPGNCYWGIYKGGKHHGAIYESNPQLTRAYYDHMRQHLDSLIKPLAKRAFSLLQ